MCYKYHACEGDYHPPPEQEYLWLIELLKKYVLGRQLVWRILRNVWLWRSIGQGHVIDHRDLKRQEIAGWC